MNKFLSKLIKPKKVVHKETASNPHNIWPVMMKVFFVLVVIMIMINLFFSYLVKNEKIFKTESTVSQPPSLLKEKLLNDVINSFNQKEIKSNDFKTIKVFKDPSL